jgi:hypothetical protein
VIAPLSSSPSFSVRLAAAGDKCVGVEPLDGALGDERELLLQERAPPAVEPAGPVDDLLELELLKRRDEVGRRAARPRDRERLLGQRGERCVLARAERRRTTWF